MTSFKHDGKSYEPKMTRAGVRDAEAQGLMASQMAEKPQSSIGLLFFASLTSRYKINPNKAVAMLDDLLDDGTFKFESLFEEMANAYSDLFGSGEPEKTE